MRRLVLVGVVGILALGAGALLVVELASSPSPYGQGAAPQGGETVPTRPSANLGALVPLAGLTPEQRAWAEARQLPAQLPVVSASVGQPVAPCFDEEVQARFGPSPHSSLPGAGGAAPGPGALVLQMEAVQGGLRVVDAPVAAMGNAGDGLVACAQQALRGRLIPFDTSAFAMGERVAMSYSLVPPASPPSSPSATSAPTQGTSSAGTAPARPAFRRQRGKGVGQAQP